MASKAPTKSASARPLENVKPFLSRCVPASPKQTTTYTFTAANPTGETKATVTVTVDPKARRAAKAAAPASAEPASSLAFFADKMSVAAGQPVMLCHDAGSATKVEITPRTVAGTLPVKGCITEKPEKTTDYTITAVFPDGHKETDKLRIQVQ